MLKIVEVKSQEHFNQLRNIENEKFDYLYILKYCNQIAMSDNGQLKNFSSVQFCETEEDYNNIENKENILYFTNGKLYFGETKVAEHYTDEEIANAINEAIDELQDSKEQEEEQP